MTETVSNPATAVSTSVQHSAAWLDSPPSTVRLSGASTSGKHHSGGHHLHHCHTQMNHHEPSPATPRYPQSVHVEIEHEVMDAANSSSSSRTNSLYRIHSASAHESVDPSRLHNVAGSLHFTHGAKRWTQFEDSEEYGSGSDDDSNEDTDDGHTVDDYDDESDKPLPSHAERDGQNPLSSCAPFKSGFRDMSSDTETRNLLEDADVGEDDDDDAELHSSDDSEDLTESVDMPDSGTLTAPKKTSVHSAYSQQYAVVGPVVSDTLYEMSPDQKQYYERCFMMLQQATQGKATISGAVNGADDRVVEFFKKSYLDSEQLSRIWMLSDVNEDGWLNLEEFSMAMHLVVLHVKGRNPIPSELPARCRPPLTPVRGILMHVPTHSANANGTHASLWTSTASDPCAEVSSTTPKSATMYTSAKQSWKLFDFDKTDSGAPYKNYSFSDEQLHLQDQPPTTSAPYKAPVAQFSDVPPILVDSRPTPVRSQPLSGTSTAISIAVSEGASQLTGIKFPLSPQNGPKGPPPKPPPRPTNRGHGRSASLDLNSMAFTTTNHPVSCSMGAPSNQLPSPPGVGGYPPILAKDRGSTLPASLQLSSMVSRSPLPPPVVPPPRRAVPQTPASSTPMMVDATSQTDEETDRMQELIAFNLQLDDRLERLSAPESEKMNWKERCEMMRCLNTELEAERAKLAQIRLQLELRLQEAEQGRGPSKPTSL